MVKGNTKKSTKKVAFNERPEVKTAHAKLFDEQLIDVKTDTPREDIEKEYQELFESGKYDAIKETRRYNTVASALIRKYAADIKNPSGFLTGLFFNVTPPKDINEWKRDNLVNSEGLPEKYVVNGLGLIYDEESGDITPFAMTMWDDIALESNEIPVEDAWVRFRASKQKTDGENYRILQSVKSTKFEITEPMFKGKPLDVITIEDAIEKGYYNIVDVDGFRKYVNSRIPTPVKGGVISVNTKPNDSGNYSYTIMGDGIVDVDSETIRIMTTEIPKYDTGSEIVAFGANAFVAKDKDKTYDSKDEEKEAERTADIILMASIILPGEDAIKLNIDETDFEEESDFDSVSDEFADEPEDEESDDEEELEDNEESDNEDESDDLDIEADEDEDELEDFNELEEE